MQLVIICNILRWAGHKLGKNVGKITKIIYEKAYQKKDPQEDQEQGGNTRSIKICDMDWKRRILETKRGDVGLFMLVRLNLGTNNGHGSK